MIGSGRRRLIYPERIPWVVWLLLAGWLVHIVLAVTMDLFVSPYGMLTVDTAVSTLLTSSSFVLAAAVVFGTMRWPAGREWLRWAAIGLGTRGVLELAGQAWLGWWETAQRGPISDLEQTLVLLRTLISSGIGVLAFGALAAGLWSARPMLRGATSPRWSLISLAIAGAAAVVGGIVLTAQYASIDPAYPFQWYSVAIVAVIGIMPGAVALLGIAALRALPARFLIPELLIAVGAALTVLGTGWVTWAQALQVLGPSNYELAWLLFTLPNLVALIGVMVVALGFALGRVSAPGDAGGGIIGPC